MGIKAGVAAGHELGRRGHSPVRPGCQTTSGAADYWVWQDVVPRYTL
jgi:hypothetical protein